MSTNALAGPSECSVGSLCDAEIADSNSPWYALRARPRWETLVADAVGSKGYETFLPLYRKTRQWSDRTKILELPLFPGYVFCRGDLSRGPRLVSTPGVIGILNFGGAPAVITNTEINALKIVVRSGVFVEPWQFVQEGERVRVFRGPLAGLEGLLVRAKGDCRVVLSVETLCRSVAVEVSRDSIAPVYSPFLT